MLYDAIRLNKPTTPIHTFLKLEEAQGTMGDILGSIGNQEIFKDEEELKNHFTELINELRY